MISLLQSEKLLTCPQQFVHHHFALVETWREVSKVLSANSLILKIWVAWGQEQANVLFSVKRIKARESESSQIRAESKGQRILRRKNSKTVVDTFHPNALMKKQQDVWENIEEQMKNIISQGDFIREHLQFLKVCLK